MDGISLQLLRRLKIFEEHDDLSLAELYKRSGERLDLALSDYLAIRDLVKISGYNEEAVHALLICMYASLSKNNICLPFNQHTLAGILKKITPAHERLAKKIISSIERYPQLVRVEESNPSLFPDAGDFRPLVYEKGKNPRLYFQKYYLYEKTFKQRLSSLLQADDIPLADEAGLVALCRGVLVDDPLRLNDSPALIDEDQVLALLLPLVKNFVIISGGPGTGKTSVILNLVRVFERGGISPARIKIAAPTGRAAQRITQALQETRPEGVGPVAAFTIHRLLEFNFKSNSFFYNKNNTLPADVIIIDEASMVDVILLAKLFDAAGAGTRLVFLGDRNQLPPVAAGSVFADLVPEDAVVSYSPSVLRRARLIVPDAVRRDTAEAPSPGEDRFVILKTNYRSDKEIIEVSEMVRKGDRGALAGFHEMDVGLFADREKMRGVWCIKDNVINLSTVLDFWTDLYYLDKSENNYHDCLQQLAACNAIDREEAPILKNIFSCLDSCRILCPVTVGPSGTEFINNYICRRVGRQTDPWHPGSLFSGMPIVMTRNDYANDLFNGESGIIIKTGGGCQAIFKRGSYYNSYPIEILNNYLPAFAVSIHKSQGSEHESILLIIDRNSEKLLSRELFYTALTRAKKFILVYTENGILEETIDTASRRESGIKWY